MNDDDLWAADLFCGGGGAAQGMIEAGFKVVGVDNNRRNGKHYPGLFVHGDAFAPPFDLAFFDLVWASPPCQRYSSMTPQLGRGVDHHPDTIPPTRKLLKGHPFTILENVPRAPIRRDVVLTGPMVGLPKIFRERWFECSFWPGLFGPKQRVPRHLWLAGEAMTITKSMCATSHYYHRVRAGKSGRVRNREACEAMGIKIPMTNAQVGEAVAPPMARVLAERARDAIIRQRRKRA